MGRAGTSFPKSLGFVLSQPTLFYGTVTDGVKELRGADVKGTTKIREVFPS